MTKLLCLVAGVMVMAGSAWAGGACCPMSGKKSADQAAVKPASAGCAMECIDTLSLTDEQKEQIKLAKADCDKTECSETASKKMSGELAKILSSEQMAAMNAYCEKNCASKS